MPNSRMVVEDLAEIEVVKAEVGVECLEGSAAKRARMGGYGVSEVGKPFHVAAKPKQEIPATQGIGAQSAEQKDLFQRLKDMVGMGGTKAPPVKKGKKTPSNQKQVRDAVKAGNKKARKKLMDL